MPKGDPIMRRPRSLLLLLLVLALAASFASPAQARSLATLVIASIEGAVVLSRALRSTGPLERVAGELEQLLVDAIRRH